MGGRTIREGGRLVTISHAILPATDPTAESRAEGEAAAEQLSMGQNAQYMMAWQMAQPQPALAYAA